MRFYILTILFPLILWLGITGNGQAQKFTMNGYISNMQSVMFEEVDDLWFSENLFHNRLNFKYYATDNLTFTMELRTRFIYGDFVKTIPGYSDFISSDAGYVDLSWLIADKPSFILTTTIDRLYFDYSIGKFQTRVGRQRINWAQNLVWNPNDIFNAYSYFDFDYAERPGSDAIRIQYYTGSSSALELVIKTDSSNKITGAGKYLFGVSGYDIQILGGILSEEDFVLGTGWSGNIKGAAFRGEFSWFHSLENTHKEEFMISISSDYTFKNSLFFGMEFLYSNIDYDYSSFGEFYFTTLSVKNIAFTDINLMAQVSYPFTPLFMGSFATIYYPSEKGFFMGPSIEYSLKENLSLYFVFQHFRGKFDSDSIQKTSFAFLRLKWNF